MSLINEALKKAQRQRSGDTLKDVPGTHETPSGRIERRGSPPRGQMMILLGAGAIVLIVLSAVVAVFVVNRTATPAAKPAIATVTPAPAVDLNAPPPTIVAPVIVPPATASEAAASAPATGSQQISDTPASPAVVTTSEPAEAAPVTPVALPPLSPGNHGDPRVWAFVDAIQVTGVRSSGNVSKVLMNDHVYRVNDYVERSLGVKLVKVDEDRLTFVDEAGATYVKNF